MAKYRPLTLYRCAALALSASLAYSSSAMGVNALVTSLQSALPRFAPAYTQVPTRAYLGPNPQRQPRKRGGVWSSAALAAAESSADDVAPSAYQTALRAEFVQTHTLAVAAEPGTSYPWEANELSPSGSTNTANGDKLTRLHLFDWKVRGGKTLDFTLYHNSETNYDDELGFGWSWTYDVYINNLSGNPVLHWGDGLSVPFTNSSGTYAAPAGV